MTAALIRSSCGDRGLFSGDS